MSDFVQISGLDCIHFGLLSWQVCHYLNKFPFVAQDYLNWFPLPISIPLKGYNKSDNLQYNTLGRWVTWTNDSSSKRLMFQVLFFFIISCKIPCKNCFNLFFYKFTKIKIKSFECPKSIRNYEKNNAWNIRHLVNESFVPTTQ